MKQIVNIFLIIFCVNSFAQKRIKSSTQEKPNVLLIYTDDHRYTGVHTLGGLDVKTPNIDKLANNGIAFTKAYLMGSFTGATCVPSRAMLQTGRQLFHLVEEGHTIPEEHTSIGEVFQQAGYHSHIVGKWHQRPPSLKRSFNSGDKIMGQPLYFVDHFRMPFSDWDETGTYSKKNCYILEYNDKGEEVRRQIDKHEKWGPIATEKIGPHTSEVIARNASKFITSYDKKDPFYMYVAFHAPHDPRQAPQKYRDMYPPEDIELTPSYMSEHPFDNGDYQLRDERLASWPRTPEVARQQLADYYAIITHLDAQIGLVIKALKKSGKYKNTLIVFAGDSGLAVGNHGLMGKQNIYDEDGIHIPFIISGDLIKDKGRRVDALCYTHDIMPTICDLVGIKTPKTVDGISLKPVIDNEVETIRNYTYHAYRQHQRAYRKGDYKLIEYVRAPDWHKRYGDFEAGSRVTQLFNIEKDPWEIHNLAYFRENKVLLNMMKKEMREKAIELGDTKAYKDAIVDFWDFY